MVDTRLISLLKVYECGSFIGASKVLSVTQPAVSQHIKSLEEELHIRIFERASGKLIVTPEGKKVIQCAQKMVGLANQLTDELSSGFGAREHLTIGVTHTAESNPIAEALAKYCAQNEGISIKIISASIKSLYKMLNTYEVDMAIVEGRTPENGLKYLMLDTDYLALAVSPNHPFAGRSLITINDLKKERLILRLPNSATRNLFNAHLESNNMSLSDFNIILELDNVATIKDLIRRDFGVSILPRSACLDELKKKKICVLPVENLSMIREMNIAYRSDFTRTDVLQGIVRSYNETLRAYI